MEYRMNEEDKVKSAETDVKNWGEIAVIGVGIKVSNAETMEDYWRIFDNQIDCIREMPQKRQEQVENFAKIFPMSASQEKINFSKGTYLEYIDEFDYPFFKITPREQN